jgi:hypothetical protein
MTATARSIPRSFTATHQTKFKNLFVSGCSFTFNNSNDTACAWPYYLRDLANFEEVYDCSQTATGTNHIFNSVINEIELGNVDIDHTLIVVMWSGLSRTDTIANTSITKPWHHMNNYNFNETLATLSIFNQPQGNSPVADLCRQYKKLIDIDAQVYESCLKIVALDAYLKQHGCSYVFTSWKDPTDELLVAPTLGSSVRKTLADLEYLGDFARKNKLLQPDLHPTPDGGLAWTRDCLIPYLESVGISYKL